MDNLLAGKLILPFLGRLLAIVMSSAAGLWKLFRDQAERDSGIGLKLFGFIAESVFTIIPESRSPCTGFLRYHFAGILKCREGPPNEFIKLNPFRPPNFSGGAAGDGSGVCRIFARR